jgi:hypothetical protein
MASLLRTNDRYPAPNFGNCVTAVGREQPAKIAPQSCPRQIHESFRQYLSGLKINLGSRPKGVRGQLE